MDAVMSPTEGVRLRREPAAKSDECTWLHSQLAQKNDELAESRQKLAELRETSELTIKTEKEKREKMEKQLDELQETIWAGENAAVLKRQIENLQEMLWQMDPLLAKEQIRACDIRAKTIVLLEDVYRLNEEMHSVEGGINKDARRRRTSEVASTNLAKLVADKEAEITFLREQISEERIRDEKDMASAQDEIVDLRTKLTKEAASSGAEDELREQLQSAQASADALSKELAEQRVEFAELEEALAASQLNLAAREEEAARLREELAALNEENAKGGRGERERELAPQAMTRLSAPPLSEQSSPRSEEIPPSEESLSSEEPPEEARAAAAPFNLFDDEPGAAPNAQSSEEQAAVKEEAEREIGGGAKQVEELPRVLVLDDLLAENSSEASSTSWSPQSSPKLPAPSSNPFELLDPAELDGAAPSAHAAYDFPLAEPFSPTAEEDDVELPSPPARFEDERAALPPLQLPIPEQEWYGKLGRADRKSVV